MAYPNSPEVGLGGSSGLDHLIKNTEFENIQHTKAIETERERIKAYKSQLEESKKQTVELENSTVTLDEQTMKLHKQFAFNQENFESLKHTSTVLGDHKDALRRKVSTLQTNVEHEYGKQFTALSKYEGIWATYQAKYESKVKVKMLRSKEEELHAVQEHNAQLEKQIQELEQTIRAMKQNHGKNSTLVSWVLQIATLRCGTSHHLTSMYVEMAMADTLRLEIDGLKVKVLETQSLLEKREMEAKIALQRKAEAKHHVHKDDVAAMETNASCANTVSNNFQAPHFENPAIATSAGLNIQTPLSLQPRNIANAGTSINSATHQQQLQQANTQRGQQTKVSRFLLEMPQLSIPCSRPVTNTTPATPRAQISITRPSVQQHSASSQANTKQRRVVTQLQMPSLALHTPSRPKLPTTSTSHSTMVSTPNQNHGTSRTATSKPSLQIRMPSQIELSRPMPVHQATNKIATHTQSGSNALLHVPRSQQQHIGSINSSSAEKAGNGVNSQQDGATDSNTSDTNTSQEMQAVEKNNASGMPQDTLKVSSVNKEAENLNTDHIARASREDESSVFNAPDVQIQQPLPLTTPTQQAMSDVSTASTSNNVVEMADPPIATYSDPTFTGFNQAPQEMDATNSTSQEPTEVYSMYGGELYQQPQEQMQMDNTMAGQYFDGGVSAFGQADGFGGSIFGGLGQGSSSFCDGGFNFGGSPATPQQQQGSGGFGFSFGGSSTPTSSSTFSFGF